MAKKVPNKGSLGFDYHNLTVEQKQKVLAISEQFPEIPRDNIAIVLQHYQFDNDKSVDGITTDGGADAFKQWSIMQSNLAKVNSKNKKKNKKKSKKDDSSISNVAAVLCNDADDSSSLHSSNIDFDAEKESNSKVDDSDDINGRRDVDSSCVCSSIVSNPSDELSLSDTVVENEGSGSPLRTATDPEDVSEEVPIEGGADSLKCDSLDREPLEKTRAASGSPRERTDDHSRNSSQKQFSRQRHGSSHHSKSSSFSEDTSSNAQKRGGFSKCRKDLMRQTVYLQRIELQLNQHLEDSCKNLKNAFTKLRKMIDERQQKLEEEMEKVREEARSLLKSRQDLSIDLKRRCDRVQSLTDSEWNDLRADIKQFVTERKYDDDLGKTIWFQWSIDNITEEIEKFGEICPVKNAYSQRQASQANTPEPSASSSVPIDNETVQNSFSTGYESAISGDVNNEVQEAKPEKDTQVKTAMQGESRPRVFSNKRYSQSNFGSRYPQNHSNRGQGFYRSRGFGGGGYRGRNHENYRQFGGDRSNDYRQQPFPNYHNRTDFTHLHDEKLADVSMNAADNSTARFAMNQGHFRGHERRQYGNYRHKAFNNFTRQRGANRAPRPNAELITPETESSVDKNANFHEVTQESKEITNGY